MVERKKLCHLFAYGYDSQDRVTAISQSTEDGEGNSNQIIYICGLVTELRSGNNVVNYEYDSKRRITALHLSGQPNYITTKYTDGSGNSDDVVLTKFVPRGNNEISDMFETTTNKKGKVNSIKYGILNRNTANPVLSPMLSYTYDSLDRVSSMQDAIENISHAYEYDTLDRETKHAFGNNSRDMEYNEYGDIGRSTIKYNNSNDDKLDYIYGYASDSTRKLLSMNVANYTENYTVDPLGRAKNIIQTIGEKTFSKTLGYYKQGDHATSRVNTILFGKDGNTDGKLTYTYDNMDNIISVNENGKQIVKYTYDKLCRLIIEENLDKNEKTCYTYDNQGNILTKSIDGVVTNYSYREGTDRLMSFGDEFFAYDNMGNPTTYRGKETTWVRGRCLATYDGNSYTYDANGIRTSKNKGGITTSYIYENGKLLRQTTGSEIVDFIYGDGVIGFRVNGVSYLYRKNLQGDVTAIYNSNGEVVGKYTYTAFGECTTRHQRNSYTQSNKV